MPVDPESENLLALAVPTAWSWMNSAYEFQGRKDPVTSSPSSRTRGDLCPGVLRPWLADDGLLVRIRLAGGRLAGEQLDALLAVADAYGDGSVYLTARANLQVRGISGADCLTEELVDAFEATGLMPSRSHELVRNVLASPQTGYAGGRVDLRPLIAELDLLLQQDPVLAGLPGRFLFVLDDGRGDLLDRRADLGLVALDGERVQLRIGNGWGPVVRTEDAPSQLVGLARQFLSRRGGGCSAAWHVRELEVPLLPLEPPAVEVPRPAPPLSFGEVAGGRHHQVVDGRLSRAGAAALVQEPVLVVTPWRGVFVPTSKEQG